jgi:aquaporin Z
MIRERHKIAMLLAEFLGAAILTLVALAISIHLNNPYFIALGMGLALAALVLVFGSISGAHFNPAITIGLLTTRRVRPLAAVVYVAAQLVGGIVAYALFTYLTNQHAKNTGHYDSRLLVSEATGAFIFALGWATVVYNRYEGFKAAAIVGSSLAVGILVASFISNGILNPAVALGMRSWVWGTYVLGPVLGVVIGFNLYALLFAPAKALLAGEKALDAREAKKK